LGSLTVRSTSLKAYKEITESGLLAQRERLAYMTIYKYGPVTGKELSKLMGIAEQWKICSVLKKKGLAREVGKRNCKITGRECYIWDLTDATKPLPIPKRLSRSELMSENKRLKVLLKKSINKIKELST